jgi:hypothetical protein
MFRNVRADQRTFILSSFTKSDVARLAGLPGRQSFTETEKINLLHHYRNRLGLVAISLKMKRPESTTGTFVKAYEKHGALFRHRGKQPLHH